MILDYQVDPGRLGLVNTIRLIRQIVPSSIVNNGGSYLTVKIEPMDAELLTEKLSEAGVSWWLPWRKNEDNKRRTKCAVSESQHGTQERQDC